VLVFEGVGWGKGVGGGEGVDMGETPFVASGDQGVARSVC